MARLIDADKVEELLVFLKEQCEKEQNPLTGAMWGSFHTMRRGCIISWPIPPSFMSARRQTPSKSAFFTESASGEPHFYRMLQKCVFSTNPLAKTDFL